MASQAFTLMKNGSTTGNWVPHAGGRSCLVLLATTFATTTKLQLLGQDGVTAIDIATLTANGKTDYDLPAGQYRLFSSGGTPAGVYADLVTVSYTY